MVHDPATGKHRRTRLVRFYARLQPEVLNPSRQGPLGVIGKAKNNVTIPGAESRRSGSLIAADQSASKEKKTSKSRMATPLNTCCRQVDLILDAKQTTLS